jgi:hypothetical protein
MDVRFGTRSLQHACNERVAMIKRWGVGPAAAVGQHLHELEAVDSLADLALFPHVRVWTDGVDGRAWVDGVEGVRVGLQWDAREAHARDDEPPWSEVTEVVVASIVIGHWKEGHGESNA